ncbi:SPOR domain-containing protein [Marinimicrobium agarilyticum]|uniref:SPOR domain-containing protein n=1 Tax=Marinimicrobium agarilyticum TaxID=306546 RepID=UPI0003F621D6|nr:SPOR domain-containing protein [Marinimicrobium agarilyticum]
MNSGLTQRLVGAVVLVAIGVIFVPTFLRDRQVEPVSTKTLIPDRPPRETVTFDNPQPPENIEPAPEPDEMFMPETSTPPADEAEERTDAQASVSAPEEAPAQEQESREEQQRREPQSQSGTESDSTTQAADGQAWVIQVASLRSADSARDLRDRLQKQGYRAYIRSASTSAGEVSRVFIGPKISRDEAEETKSEVDKALKVDALIMRFEP